MSGIAADFVRAFGHDAADLDVAFGGPVPDAATTAVLAACTGGEPAALRGWSLARRLQALLRVRLASGPSGDPSGDTSGTLSGDPSGTLSGAPLTAVLRCTACGERFELELDPAQCCQEADDGPTAWTAPDGSTLALRLPTAQDVRDWREAALADERALAAALLGRPAHTLPEAWLPALAAALAERDPFTALHVQAPCPECGHRQPADIDLEALLLADFAARQRRLLDEVATLARAFHWSEAQILALPAWRRAHYIAHIEGALTS